MSSRDEAHAFCERELPRLVRGLTVHLGGDVAVAEELAQEALLRALTRWPRVSRLDAPGAWVWRVATNLATSHLRRKRVEERVGRALAGRRRIDATSEHGPPLDGDLVEAVRRLPRRQREVVVYRHVLDWSVEQTAEQLGVSADAVKALSRRARASLGVQLSPPTSVPLRRTSDADR